MMILIDADRRFTKFYSRRYENNNICSLLLLNAFATFRSRDDAGAFGRRFELV